MHHIIFKLYVLYVSKSRLKYKNATNSAKNFGKETRFWRFGVFSHSKYRVHDRFRVHIAFADYSRSEATQEETKPTIRQLSKIRSYDR